MAAFYIHRTVSVPLATEICRKGAALAGFPYAEFQITPCEQDGIPVNANVEPVYSHLESTSSLTEPFAPFKRRRFRLRV